MPVIIKSAWTSPVGGCRHHLPSGPDDGFGVVGVCRKPVILTVVGTRAWSRNSRGSVNCGSRSLPRLNTKEAQ